MPLHDFKCTKCNEVLEDLNVTDWDKPMIHAVDGGELEIIWNHKSYIASVTASERTVVYEDPKTGEVVYPASATADMPLRYRQRGFQKVAFEHAKDLEKFEKSHNVASESYWYNSGNGA